MPHEAHVRHHIPGRMRVKVPQAKGQPRVLQQIQHALASLPGIQQVEINPATGSVLISYEAGRHAEFHTQLAEQAARAELFTLPLPELAEVEELAANIEAEAEFLGAHSELARRMITAIQQLNAGVRRASSNTVDLKVLLPLGLALYAVAEAGTEAVTPLWVTLGIFAFNSFVALHHPRPSTAGEPLASY